VLRGGNLNQVQFTQAAEKAGGARIFKKLKGCNELKGTANQGHRREGKGRVERGERGTKPKRGQWGSKTTVRAHQAKQCDTSARHLGHSPRSAQPRVAMGKRSASRKNGIVAATMDHRQNPSRKNGPKNAFGSTSPWRHSIQASVKD